MNYVSQDLGSGGGGASCGENRVHFRPLSDLPLNTDMVMVGGGGFLSPIHQAGFPICGQIQYFKYCHCGISFLFYFFDNLFLPCSLTGTSAANLPASAYFSTWKARNSQALPFPNFLHRDLTQACLPCGRCHPSGEDLSIAGFFYSTGPGKQRQSIGRINALHHTQTGEELRW